MASWLWGRDEGDCATQAQVKVNKFRRITDEAQRAVLLADLRDLAQRPQTHEIVGTLIPDLFSHLKGTKDLESHRAATEILAAVVKPTPSGEAAGGEAASGRAAHVPLVNTEAVAKKEDNIAVLLEAMGNGDCYVRYSVCQLMEHLITNGKLMFLQGCVLSQPMGVSRLMDVLRDRRDFVRNEGLLLMIALCEGNQEIQKITAFESAFETCFDIIHEEGGNDGGVIVLDAIQLMKTLLRGNSSNITYFRELRCMEKIPQLLKLEGSDNWILTDVKQRIVVAALGLVRQLVPRHSAVFADNQKILHKLSVTDDVLKLALGRVNSLSIRTAALQVLADLLAGDGRNDVTTWFSAARVTLASATTGGPSQQAAAIHRLITVLLESGDPGEQFAALVAFRCYMRDNDEGQIAIASTFTPSPHDEMEPPPSLTSTAEATQPITSTSIGRQLLANVFSWGECIGQSGERVRKAWFATMATAEILKSNDSKVFSIQVPLHLPVPGQEQETLMSKTLRNLHELCRLKPVQGKSFPGDCKVLVASFLVLLCTWCYQCPRAVKELLEGASNIPLLIELTIHPQQHLADSHVQGLAAILIAVCLAFNPDDEEGHAYSVSKLRGLLLDRVGKEKFTSALNKMRKSYAFIAAEQDEDEDEDDAEHGNRDDDFGALGGGGGDDTWGLVNRFLFDNDFTHLFKTTYDTATRVLRRKVARGDEGTGRGAMVAVHASGSSGVAVPTVDDGIVTDLMQQIDEYKEIVDSLETDLQTNSRVCENLKGSLREHDDMSGTDMDAWSLEQVSLEYKRLYDRQVEEYEKLHEQFRSLSVAYTELETFSNSLRSGTAGGAAAPSSAELIALRKENADLKKLTDKMEEEQKELRRQLAVERERWLASASNGAVGADAGATDKLRRELKEQQEMYKSLEAEQEELLLNLVKEELKNEKLEKRLKDAVENSV